MQEAMNLGWKLAATLRGEAAAGLLDTYEAERRRISTAVIRATDVATRAMTTAHPVVARARRIVVPAVLASRRRNRFVAERLSGIGARNVASGHVLALRPRGAEGRRLPDVGVLRPDGASSTLFRELRDGSFVLVDAGRGTLTTAAQPWRARVTVVRPAGQGSSSDDGESFLSRPDGYCAWRGPADDAAGLVAALRRWCAPVPTDLPRQPRPAAGRPDVESIE
jgi:hypothetical protein